MLQESKKSGGADRISKRRGLNAQTVCEAGPDFRPGLQKDKQENILLSEYGSLKEDAMICLSVVYGPIKMTRCKQQKLSAWAINQVEYKAELHRIGDREKVEEVISFAFQFFLTFVGLPVCIERRVVLKPLWGTRRSRKMSSH